MDNNVSIYEELQQQHKDTVFLLSELEKELIRLIGETENIGLQSKFIEWQKQRSKCNESLLRMLNGMGHKY